MDIHIFDSKQHMGQAAAEQAARAINQAINANGHANIILATGASQFEMLDALVKQPVAWSRVTVFHLDEYVGMPITHPASFRKYLKERFEDRLHEILAQFHYVDGEAPNPQAECERLGELISSMAIDVACIGIGENGHLAFNDPPADFETETPFLVVELDEACRRQQHGEGWFESLDDVPTHAISMGIRQIMKSRSVICTVPDERKSDAVCRAVRGEVTNMLPASILQEHDNCSLYLDHPAAKMLLAR